MEPGGQTVAEYASASGRVRCSGALPAAGAGSLAAALAGPATGLASWDGLAAATAGCGLWLPSAQTSSRTRHKFGVFELPRHSSNADSRAFSRLVPRPTTVAQWIMFTIRPSDAANAAQPLVETAT